MKSKYVRLVAPNGARLSIGTNSAMLPVVLDISKRGNKL